MNRETDSGVPRRDARWLVWRRLATLGGACAVAVAVGGGGIELWRLGASTEAAFSRLQRVVRASITDAARDLTDVAHGLAGRADLADRIGGDREQVQALFAALQTITGSADLELAVTIYGPGGLPEAWSGRPSEIAPDRVTGGTSLFATPGPLGLRLVAVEPVLRRRGSAEGEGRVGTVVVERLLSPDQPTPGTPEPAFRFASSSAPVLLRVWSGPRDAAADASRFVVKGPDGARLLEADVLPAALAGARRAWRSRVLSLVVLILAVTVLLLAGPLLDWRARARSTEDYMSAVVSLVGVILTGQVLLRWALPSRWRATSPSTLLAPAVSRDVGFTTVDLLLGAFVVVALVGVSAHLVDRWRRASRRRRRAAASDAATQRRFTVEHAVAGTVVALGFAGYATALRSIIDRTDVDVLHLSLHPWDADRLTLIAGLHLLHAGAVWAAVVVFSASLARWRLDRHRRDLAVRVMAAWGLPILLVVGLARMLSVPLPASPLLLVTGAAMGAALMAPRGVARFRHASQGSRLVGLFLALLAPALLMYPMTVEFADRAERRVIATQYARQATNHADSVERSLTSSLVQIDEIADLPAMLTPIPAPRGAAGYSDNALLIWRQTDLAARRLTSAVELYTPGGARVSRFAVNVPEYAPAPPRPSVGCAWEVFSEASPFSGHEGQIVHAQRTVCRTGRDGAVDRVGTVVVHVMLDYRVLPFVAPDSPYVELFRRERVPPEGTSGRDVELVIYGWGLRYPIFASAGDAWPIADETFDRVRMSREPFWTTLTKGGVPYNVYITNDRAGIYALGIPARGPFDRLLHGAEIATLAGLTFIVLLLGATLLSRLARRRPRVGRLLLLEIKASFYRKLFLAFVAAAVVPVLVLALMIRAYFATQLRADVEAEAIRTAAVAQRVIQEMATLSQASDDELTPLSDGVMVWISQAIDQDVNIFDGPRLVATSERDLFASGLLPVRTPGDVFHAIALQRLPSFVGADTIGDLRYMLAATPVRAGDRDAILTVPLASRQQEIEREIDSLDRGIHLGAVLFIMLGAGIGLSMAERIADPVKRLTRVTQQIARGDFDARVAVRSADELQRLVEAFNAMAAELKAQRDQLERTNRLEAWAEMARQVAHEIKNPLTPIQLSAEHLRRVHTDRGAPLAPVLESCVESILTQVRLLRQISAEFSSFASSPSARPTLIALGELVHEAIESYRVGLGDRIPVTVDVPSGLPTLLLDRALVLRAVINIVENALHAMPGPGTLSISAIRIGPQVQLTITDTGVGMDKDTAGRIFEPYFSTRATGSGLGLSIAKRNIEMNGGTIALTSAKGHGTTVTVSLSLDGSPDA